MSANLATFTDCLCRSSARGGLAPGDVTSLRELSHQLAGAGGTFGYAEVSRAAATCQLLADEALARPDRLEALGANLTAALEDLIAALQVSLKQEM